MLSSDALESMMYTSPRNVHPWRKNEQFLIMWPKSWPTSFTSELHLEMVNVEREPSGQIFNVTRQLI